MVFEGQYINTYFRKFLIHEAISLNNIHHITLYCIMLYYQKFHEESQYLKYQKTSFETHNLYLFQT